MTRKCENCGSDMVLRKNSATNETFYGCINYPKCCYTEEEDCISKKHRIEKEKEQRKERLRAWLNN